MYKVGSLHAALLGVRRTWLLSLHSNALGGLKVETTTTLCICIYCSPHAFAFSYGSLTYTKKLPGYVTTKRMECDGRCVVARIRAIDPTTISRRSINHETKRGSFLYYEQCAIVSQRIKRIPVHPWYCFTTNNPALQGVYLRDETTKILMN